MSIRARIHLFQLIIGAAVLMMVVVAFVTVRSTDYYLTRVQWANHQLEAITALAMHANRFSEQIAELLLIGQPERVDFDSARAELEAGFDRLEQVTRDEFAFLESAGAAADERDEIFRLQRMRELYGEIDRAVAKLFTLREEGRLDDAIRLFRREIENRLDAEFENLLTAAVLDEQEEVAQAEREAEALWRQLAQIMLTATVTALAVCLVAGILLARALTRPIRLLTQGTEAISRGELDHRIAYAGNHELGTLARRFNEMATQLEAQRTLLLEARSELERQVAERTAELAAANQRLTDLDRLRAQFLADISHELRTPLTVLRGEAEISLRHGSKPEPVYRDTLERIVAQTTDMSRLVDDLLFLARSETDTIRFEPLRLILQDVMADAVREGQAMGRSKNIPIDVEEPAEPIWIEADAQRLKQAFVIVLDNAIKYSPPGRSVIVRMSATDGHGKVMVRDQGVGIPAEDLPHVFERFYRGRVSGPSRGAGSGLGLAIAKWLVEKHGGEIAIASEAGRFTEVHIRIPRMEGAAVGQSAVGGG